ncbi:ImmA/IrrE family metallo-endopeptidase [Actinomyces slackii]|uniref:Domain of uncharacterized function (DUF955) n=1 Tax=Actinomyces slackii TaxID=52774 RepID=A0A3S5EMA3_9ACTO|nr:ImmA/IrrE family metallo-endopeptidase [Actinomyces slackii]VEG75272.1 Domain of uncharacterised function (DUF955) [Actinomyces slackii]
MSTQEQGRLAAERFRCEHALGTAPIGDLIELIEKTTECDVAIVDAPDEEHGLTMTDSQRGVTFMAVATTQHPMRQRSTLAHELSHLLHHDLAIDLPDPQNGMRPAPERLADAFARHLLVPLPAVEQARPRNGVSWELDDLSDLVRSYLASPAMVAIQLSIARHISQERKREWMGVRTPELATRFGWRTYYDSLSQQSQKARPPRRLLERAIEGYRLGVVKPQILATLQRNPLSTVLSELKSAGITPVAVEPTWQEAGDAPLHEVDLDELDALLGDSPE